MLQNDLELSKYINGWVGIDSKCIGIFPTFLEMIPIILEMIPNILESNFLGISNIFELFQLFWKWFITIETKSFEKVF